MGSAREPFKQQLAKTYGHGGFYRHTIKDERLLSAPSTGIEGTLAQSSAKAKLREPMSPQPRKENLLTLPASPGNGPAELSAGEKEDIQTVGSDAEPATSGHSKRFITMMRKKLKQSSVPLATGKKETTEALKARRTDLKTLIAEFEEAAIKSAQIGANASETKT